MSEQLEILLIEDEKAHAYLIQRAFLKGISDAHVEVVGTLKKAREYLSRTAPDLVISDMFLPDGRGTEILSKNRDEIPYPVIVMTSHGDEESAVEAMRLGALDYVVKSESTLTDLPHIARRALREWNLIVERKKAQDALKESEQKYRLLAETARDLIFVHDMNGRIIYANQMGMETIGISEEDLRGKSILDYVYPEYHQELLERQERRLAGEQDTFLYEVQFREKNNNRVSVEVNSSPIVENGEITSVLVVARDVSERKKAEEDRKRLEIQIQQSQKLESLGVLAGGIAHDFNNLLMGMLGNASMALQELSAVSLARQSIESIRVSAQRAADLTRQLLAYSGQGKFLVQVLDLNDLIREMGHLLKVSVSSNAVIRYNLHEDIPPIEADATQIRQIVMNLITNASEAMEDQNGVISISTGTAYCDEDYLQGAYLNDGLPPGEYVFMEISDTGCGMDKETLKRIFDPFFTTKFTGRGLGLAAVLGIVRSHNGALKVYSEPNEGTNFKILLPISEKAIIKKKTAKKPQDGWQGIGTVLIVDDEEIVRTLASKMVAKAGFSYRQASDGQEAVEILKEKDADDIVCVLLDMTMPHMNGEEAFNHIHRMRKDLPVVLSSGFNELETTKRFAGKGLAGFIQKPYEYDDLIRKIKSAIEKNNE